MHHLFLDESGDHSLSVIDPQYPVFVLGGVILDAAYAATQIQAAGHRFKLEAIGHSDVTLHKAGGAWRSSSRWASVVLRRAPGAYISMLPGGLADTLALDVPLRFGRPNHRYARESSSSAPLFT